MVGGDGTGCVAFDEDCRGACVDEDSRCCGAVGDLQDGTCERGGEAGKHPLTFVFGDDGPDPGRHVEVFVAVAHYGSFACAHEPSWKKCLRPYAGMIRIRCVGRRIASLSAPPYCQGSRASRHTLHPDGEIYQLDHRNMPGCVDAAGHVGGVRSLVPRPKVDTGARLPHVLVVNDRRFAVNVDRRAGLVGRDDATGNVTAGTQLDPH